MRSRTPEIPEIEMANAEQEPLLMSSFQRDVVEADGDIEMQDATALVDDVSIVDVEMEDLESETRLRMPDESSLDEITARLAALRLYDEVDNGIDQITKGLGALCIHDEVDDLINRLQRLTLSAPSESVSTAPATPDAGPDIDNAIGTFVDYDMDALVRSTAMVNLNECGLEERHTRATSAYDLPIEDFAKLRFKTDSDVDVRDEAPNEEVTTDEEELPLLAELMIEEEVSGARFARC